MGRVEVELINESPALTFWFFLSQVMMRNDDEMKEMREKLSGAIRGNIDQQIKNRYHGVNDALANKMMKVFLGHSRDFASFGDIVAQHAYEICCLQGVGEDKLEPLTPPDDQTITTLFVGGIPEDVQV